MERALNRIDALAVLTERLESEVLRDCACYQKTICPEKMTRFPQRSQSPSRPPLGTQRRCRAHVI